MHRTLTGVVLAAGVILTTACAEPTVARPAVVARPAISATGAQQVTVKVGNSMSFEPKSIALRAGQLVELTVQNTGHVPHDFTLTSGVAAPVVVQAPGGKTATATFTIQKPGTYTFVCGVPGHADAGMRGTLTVE
jgi:uncharacterized cupredoxin-like copper-binding protein